MRVRHPHQGFTLIELMIVIAITAILVPVTLSTYLDYTTRPKVTAMSSVADGPKIFITESCQSDPNQLFRSIIGVPPIT